MDYSSLGAIGATVTGFLIGFKDYGATLGAIATGLSVDYDYDSYSDYTLYYYYWALYYSDSCYDSID